MPPLNDVISPRGQRIYTQITISAPPRTAETQPPAALKWVAEKAVDSYLSERAARYTAGAEAAWAELKQLERTDCRLRAAREQA